MDYIQPRFICAFIHADAVYISSRYSMFGVGKSLIEGRFQPSVTYTRQKALLLGMIYMIFIQLFAYKMAPKTIRAESRYFSINSAPRCTRKHTTPQLKNYDMYHIPLRLSSKSSPGVRNLDSERLGLCDNLNSLTCRYCVCDPFG
jgi:hypothetical protein